MMRTAGVVVLLLVVASSASAQDGKRRRQATDSNRVVGTIKGISDDGKLLMVAPDAARKKASKTLEIKVTSRTQIVIPKGRKQKLQVDDHVTVALDPKDASLAVGVKVDEGSSEPPKKKKKDATN